MITLRKKNRLEKRLYNTGYFFVTICTHDKISYFGEVDVGADTIRLNPYGKVVEECLFSIPSIYKDVSLGDMIIMPNHIHMILSIEKDKAIDNRPYGELSKVIKGFKQVTTKRLHDTGLSSFKRQRSFYDHIIRNEEDLLRIQEYIELNPYKWKNDEYYIG